MDHNPIQNLSLSNRDFRRTNFVLFCYAKNKDEYVHKLRSVVSPRFGALVHKMVFWTTSVAVSFATPMASRAGTTVRSPEPVSHRSSPPGAPVSSVSSIGTPPAASSTGEYLIEPGFFPCLFEGFKIRVKPGMKVLSLLRFKIGSSLPICHLCHV